MYRNPLRLHLRTYATSRRFDGIVRRGISDHATQFREPPLVFAFDIDGVLVRGAQALPAAKRALNILQGDNPMRMKIPFILMTNGGGLGEEERCRRLTSRLGFEIRPSQFIQAHTVLKTVVHKYADHPVLVLGGRNDDIRKVAERYGFKHAYTTLDVKAWNPAVWPFHDLTEAERASTKEVDFSKTPIRAIFVYHDPRNWALDVQVICDVILSGGLIGGPYKDPDGSVELIFCNPDLLWRNEFDRPRIGQGGFRVAFQAVYKELTGSNYPYTQYGKPTAATYQFAETVLRKILEDLQGKAVHQMPSVYMVGDNPESDIAGANGAGWHSVLVHTGVYEPENGPPTHTPSYEANDVEEAIRIRMRVFSLWICVVYVCSSTGGMTERLRRIQVVQGQDVEMIPRAARRSSLECLAQGSSATWVQMASLGKEEDVDGLLPVARRSLRIQAREIMKAEANTTESERPPGPVSLHAEATLKQETHDELPVPNKTPRKRKAKSSTPQSATKRVKAASASPSKTEYAPPELFAHLAPLPDLLRPGLDILFCGINPGVESARVGHHFAHRSNRFWKALFLSGLTSRVLLPSEEALLPTEYNIGLTDLVERPTAAAAQLSRTADMVAGVPHLLAKIYQCRPAVVCFVGRSIADVFCSHAFDPPKKPPKGTDKQEVWGLRPLKLVYSQSEEHESPFKETLFFVIPSTSGANAAYNISDTVRLLEALRKNVGLIKSGGMDTTYMDVIPFPPQSAPAI
ncbi:hypothetical protein NM688_g7188 [Phlebia brevispora]|uniref:Uncharacterized protein n=1 Tax=Phlebia brevispora TaxID=194682 RepID=A0ACC1S888_9APHY|nr:hypothetical protein NM688_g7188 [Phlebia brevispora]